MGGGGAGGWVPSFYLVTALLNDLSESFVLGQGHSLVHGYLILMPLMLTQLAKGRHQKKKSAKLHTWPKAHLTPLPPRPLYT